MQMKDPVHPGRIVREDCLAPLSLTVTEAAKVLAVSRQTLNNLVNGRSGVSLEMAIRLSKAFGSTAQAWVRMQAKYDLSIAMKRADEIEAKRYVPPNAA